MIIGITGGTGCGKTTLLDAIRQAGGMILDCDAIYHQLLKNDAQLLQTIENRFPGVVENGQLQRKKLGQIVFADENALQDLNRITHGAVKEEVIRRIQSAESVHGADESAPYEGDSQLIAIDAYALFDSGLSKLCKLTVAVTAPISARVQRITARDGISAEYALARIQAQKSNEEFSALCDYTLDNHGTLEDFQGKCLAFLREIGIM